MFFFQFIFNPTLPAARSKTWTLFIIAISLQYLFDMFIITIGIIIIIIIMYDLYVCRRCCALHVRVRGGNMPGRAEATVLRDRQPVRGRRHDGSMRVGHVLPLAHDLRDHVGDERCRVRVAVPAPGVASVAQGPGPRPEGRGRGTVVRHGAGRGRAGRSRRPRPRGRADGRGPQLLVGVHAPDRVEADADHHDHVHVHAAVRPVRVDHVLGVRAPRLQRAVGQHHCHRAVVRGPRAGRPRLLRPARHQAGNAVRRLERRHGRVTDRRPTVVGDVQQRVHQLRPGHRVLRVRVLVPVGHVAVALDIMQRIISACHHRYI